MDGAHGAADGGEAHRVQVRGDAGARAVVAQVGDGPGQPRRREAPGRHRHRPLPHQRPPASSQRGGGDQGRHGAAGAALAGGRAGGGRSGVDGGGPGGGRRDAAGEPEARPRGEEQGLRRRLRQGADQGEGGAVAAGGEQHPQAPDPQARGGAHLRPPRPRRPRPASRPRRRPQAPHRRGQRRGLGQERRDRRPPHRHEEVPAAAGAPRARLVAARHLPLGRRRERLRAHGRRRRSAGWRPRGARPRRRHGLAAAAGRPAPRRPARLPREEELELKLGWTGAGGAAVWQLAGTDERASALVHDREPILVSADVPPGRTAGAGGPAEREAGAAGRQPRHLGAQHEVSPQEPGVRARRRGADGPHALLALPHGPHRRARRPPLRPAEGRPLLPRRLARLGGPQTVPRRPRGVHRRPPHRALLAAGPSVQVWRPGRRPSHHRLHARLAHPCRIPGCLSLSARGRCSRGGWQVAGGVDGAPHACRADLDRSARQRPGRRGGAAEEGRGRHHDHPHRPEHHPPSLN
mmetsp:Transcript_15343/g.26319  ORF Transcript_15343/g.26319 Transcript_15343/m.26319 type:complete len:521 (-) Transcript_15343:33-1595(-)